MNRSTTVPTLESERSSAPYRHLFVIETPDIWISLQICLTKQKELYSLHSSGLIQAGMVNKSGGGGLPEPPGCPFQTRPHSALDLTLYGVSRRCLASPLGFIADPLLAALSRDFDPPWGLAPHARRLRLRTQPHAADGTVHANTLVLAARREALAVAVDDAIVFAP